MRAELWTTADDIPAVAGAYVLVIDLCRVLAVRIRRKNSTLLSPGRYLYCGSANGPGGLRARIARHMRRGKPMHWHIDSLTEAGVVVGAWTFPGSHECDLVTALSHLPIAMKGFGSSDCRSCASHLLRCLHADFALRTCSGRTPPARIKWGRSWPKS